MSRVFTLPDVGEGLTEAEILRWHVAPGDTVALNQIIVEIETAKAAVELPSPFAGVVGELLAEPGATVAVGAPIITIDGDAAEPAAAGSIGEQGPGGRITTLVGYGPRTATVTRRPRKAIETAAASYPEGSVPLAKPPVRKLAKELGIDLRPVLTADSLAIVVEDEGAGLGAPDLTAEAAAAEARTRGLSFGLAVARSLLEAHGGELRLEAQPGVGARAWLILPRARMLGG